MARRDDGRRYLSDDEVEALGLGDVVSIVARRLGLKECPDCQRRKARLNQLAPRVIRRRRRA